MRIYLIIALLLSLLVTAFAVQNHALVTLNLLFWQIDGSLAIFLMATLTIGFIIGLLVSTPANIRQRLRILKILKESQSLEKELKAINQTGEISPVTESKATQTPPPVKSEQAIPDIDSDDPGTL